ncbi:MAG: branched-chain amino acid ABC transporter permease [Acidimicrobiales bacterium]|nr:branched-chain amino acid ABC transporter permease [Acidimicrobiales bacterium]
MDLFLARLFDGLGSGATYAALAMALVLIFKATTLINFAQGELALLGAYLVLVLGVEQGLPIVVAVFLAMVITAVFAAGLERVFIRPFDPSDHLPLVIVTLGLFLGINSVAGVIWGHGARDLPSMFPDGNLYSRGVANLSWVTVGNVATVLATAGALYLLLNKTKIGLAFRAVSSNLESSELVGINIGRTLQFGWALAAAVGTLGAALAILTLFLEPTVMLRVLIFAFAAAALGGLDSLGGAVVGGFVVGLVRSMGVGYLDFVPSELGVGAAVVVIIAVLLIRPTGLFGSEQVQRV